MESNIPNVAEMIERDYWECLRDSLTLSQQSRQNHALSCSPVENREKVLLDNALSHYLKEAASTTEVVSPGAAARPTSTMTTTHGMNMNSSVSIGATSSRRTCPICGMVFKPTDTSIDVNIHLDQCLGELG